MWHSEQPPTDQSKCQQKYLFSYLSANNLHVFFKIFPPFSSALIWWKVLSTITKNHALKGGKLDSKYTIVVYSVFRTLEATYFSIYSIFTQEAVRITQQISIYVISNLIFPPFSSETNLMENLVDNDKIFFKNKENCTQKRNSYCSLQRDPFKNCNFSKLCFLELELGTYQRSWWKFT